MEFSARLLLRSTPGIGERFSAAPIVRLRKQPSCPLCWLAMLVAVPPPSFSLIVSSSSGACSLRKRWRAAKSYPFSRATRSTANRSSMHSTISLAKPSRQALPWVSHPPGYIRRPVTRCVSDPCAESAVDPLASPKPSSVARPISVPVSRSNMTLADTAESESRGGIAPPRAPRTVRELLSSYGSQCSALVHTVAASERTDPVILGSPVPASSERVSDVA
jgi:hypothetical protein